MFLVVSGIDFSRESILEARRRVQERSNDRLLQQLLTKPEYHVGNALEERAWMYGAREVFDVVSIQLAIHYMVASEQQARDLLSRCIARLDRRGKLLGSTMCCREIVKNILHLQKVQQPDDPEDGDERSQVLLARLEAANGEDVYASGNHLFSLFFSKQTLMEILPPYRLPTAEGNEQYAAAVAAAAAAAAAVAVSPAAVSAVASWIRLASLSVSLVVWALASAYRESPTVPYLLSRTTRTVSVCLCLHLCLCLCLSFCLFRTENARGLRLFECVAAEEVSSLALHLLETLTRRFGIKYHFWLRGTIDAEEFVLPFDAFRDIAATMGLKCCLSASFPRLLDAATRDSKMGPDIRGWIGGLKARRGAILDEPQARIFALYKAFSFVKAETETEQNPETIRSSNA